MNNRQVHRDGVDITSEMMGPTTIERALSVDVVFIIDVKVGDLF